jgi:hypothetical protein
MEIPAPKGGGYLTGFAWGTELRLMVRHCYLHEDLVVATIDVAERPDTVVFLLRGVFPPLLPAATPVVAELASVFICQHLPAALIEMPANTLFNSVTIAIARPYLRQLFGQLPPLVRSLLETTNPFAVETSLSAALLQTARDLLPPPVPESLARPYYTAMRLSQEFCNSHYAFLSQANCAVLHGHWAALPHRRPID